LNWMAASNINSDAAIRARFSGSADSKNEERHIKATKES
jgi:hypothetical protein